MGGRPTTWGPDGNARHEGCGSMYATAGKVGSEARLSTTTNAGKIDGTSMKYTPTKRPGDVRDLRVVQTTDDGVL